MQAQPAVAPAASRVPSPPSSPAAAPSALARPSRYAPTCNSSGWLRQLPSAPSFSQRLLSPFVSATRSASSASSFSASSASRHVTPPLSPVSSANSATGDAAADAAARAVRDGSGGCAAGRDGVYRFCKLRGRSFAMYLADGGEVVLRASVKCVTEVNESALRIAVRLSPGREAGSRDGGGSRADGGGDAVRASAAATASPSTVVLECDVKDDWERWRAAFVEATSSTFDEHYKKMSVLGKGHFSNVHLVVDRSTGERFACKVIKKDPRQLEKSRKFIRREVKVLSVTSHQNIVNAVDFFSHRNKPHILLELLEHGNLKDLIVERGRIPEPEARHIFFGILAGVRYLHDLRIVHRDMKPENILLGGTRRPTGWVPKITDFGLSTFLGEHDRIYSTVGTPSYVSPELCAGVPYGTSVDMWSCGVILYYMLSGERPFVGDTRSETKAAILRGRLEFPEELFRRVGKNARLLIQRMLDMEQTTRITAKAAMRHPWFEPLDKSAKESSGFCEQLPSKAGT